MRRAFGFSVCGVAAILFAAGCTSAEPQRGILSLRGKRADVFCIKQRGLIKLSVVARQKKSERIDWSTIKAVAGCFPPESIPGGFSFEIPLVSTNQVKGPRASATFILKADAAIINKIDEVRAESGDNAVGFSMPLSHNEVLERFRQRASADEIWQFDRFRRSHNSDDRDRALELVLSKLTWNELERVGIGVEIMIFHPGPPAQVYESPGTLDIGWWDVAGTSLFDGAAAQALRQALERANIPFGESGGPGSGWWVAREDFLRARKVLITLKNPDIRVAGAPLFKP